MRSIRTGGALAALAALLVTAAACGGGDDGNGLTGLSRQQEAELSSAATAYAATPKVPAVCDLLSAAEVGRLIDTSVDRSKETGGNCLYLSSGDEEVASLLVQSWPSDGDSTRFLDQIVPAKNGYQPVAGVGDAARYKPSDGYSGNELSFVINRPTGMILGQVTVDGEGRDVPDGMKAVLSMARAMVGKL